MWKHMALGHEPIARHLLRGAVLRDLVGDVALPSSYGVCHPVLGEVKLAVDERVPFRGRVPDEETHLAVVDLAQAPTELTLHSYRVAPLLHERSRIDDEDP